jgi:hypothetical protein
MEIQIKMNDDNALGFYKLTWECGDDVKELKKEAWEIIIVIIFSRFS